MPAQNPARMLERLLKVTTVSRDAFARAAKTVPSSDLAENFVERALDLARIADDLRDQLALDGGLAKPQSTERAQVFVVTVLEARRAYRLAMSDAMRLLMENPPTGTRVLQARLPATRPVTLHTKRHAVLPRHRPAATDSHDRPVLRLVFPGD